ncbi:MAG: hypothetical protein KGJ49_03175, partial [Alphaproteobacteria bacterium]|nr:hypothetical protein [Alphaproteobacteria bacterium]
PSGTARASMNALNAPAFRRTHATTHHRCYRPPRAPVLSDLSQPHKPEFAAPQICLFAQSLSGKTAALPRTQILAARRLHDEFHS